MTVSRSFSLEARSSWGWAGRGELQHPWGGDAAAAGGCWGGPRAGTRSASPPLPHHRHAGGTSATPQPSPPSSGAGLAAPWGCASSGGVPSAPPRASPGRPSAFVPPQSSAHLAGGLFWKGWCGTAVEVVQKLLPCAWVGGGCRVLCLSCRTSSSFPPDRFRTVLIP